MAKIGDLDLQILSELSEDAAISIPKLSKKIKVNPSVVYSRIKRLVKRKLIERFTIVVNDQELGHQVKALAGINMDWMIDVDIDLTDAEVGLGATHDDDSIHYGTEAMIMGSGEIGIIGFGDGIQGRLLTSVKGEDSTKLYAASGLGVAGCLVDCAEEPCNECPDYMYFTFSLGKIKHGSGEIFIAESANLNTQKLGTVNGQVLAVHGEGDFDAYMETDLWIGDEEPLSHVMGAYGQNVEFCAFGITGMNTDSGENVGFFTANMHFNDPGPCPEIK